MQILGTKAFDEGIEGIANRSGRSVVREWALRVLKRHVRRETDLVSEVPSRSKSKDTIIKMMDLDEINKDIQERILKEWEAGATRIYVPDRLKIQIFFQKAEETMDWLESLPDSDRRIRRIERMSWKEADEAAKSWHESLAKAKVDNSIRLSGVVGIHNFDNGNFIAKLTTAQALKAEGAMMGHCVGGYWKSVDSGEKQIYSLRDSLGYPHATIEMRPTPKVIVDENTSYNLSGTPQTGINTACITESNWVAVQVRGKQNHEPVAKYMKQLLDWFMEKKIPWHEYGDNRIPFMEGEEIVYFHLKDKNFTNMDLAHRWACMVLKEELSSRSKYTNFERSYVSSGMRSLHSYCADKNMIKEFLTEITPFVSALFKKQAAKNPFLVAFKNSGIDNLTKMATRFNLNTDTVDKIVFDSICHNEEDAVSKFYREHLLKINGISEGIDVIRHELPLGPLSIIAHDLGRGKETEVLELIKPHLIASIDIMKEYPDCIHVVKSTINGVTADHINQAYLYSGLSSEYGAAQSNIAKALGMKISALKLSVKKARPSATLSFENINLLRNMINDGYEKRIVSAATSKFGNGLVVGFAPEKKSVAPKIQADPVVKNVGMSSFR